MILSSYNGWLVNQKMYYIKWTLTFCRTQLDIWAGSIREITEIHSQLGVSYNTVALGCTSILREVNCRFICWTRTRWDSSRVFAKVCLVKTSMDSGKKVLLIFGLLTISYSLLWRAYISELVLKSNVPNSTKSPNDNIKRYFPLGL